MNANWPDLIREVRHRTNMKQDALAAELGVSQASISLWERGVANPPADIRAALSKLYSELPAAHWRMSVINSVKNSPNLCGLFSLKDGEFVLEMQSAKGFELFPLLTQEDIGQPLNGKLGEESDACIDELIKAGIFSGDIAQASSVVISERDGIKAAAIATHTPFRTESGWLLRSECRIMTEQEAIAHLDHSPALTFVKSEDAELVD
jgi:transcriptional regulator with XRE-family HTH domain